MIQEIKEGYYNKIKNKLFGLLCEYEKEGQWEDFLDNIIIELQGIPEDYQTINHISLISKVCSLRYLRYEYFRKTIFDCMSMLSKEA